MNVTTLPWRLNPISKITWRIGSSCMPHPTLQYQQLHNRKPHRYGRVGTSFKETISTEIFRDLVNFTGSSTSCSRADGYRPAAYQRLEWRHVQSCRVPATSVLSAPH